MINEVAFEFNFMFKCSYRIKTKALMNGPMICKHDKFEGLSKRFETFQIFLDC
jgi:hypothetical protein